MKNHKARTSTLYKRLLHYVKPFWWVFMIGVLGNMTYAGIDAGFVYMLKPLMNKGFIARDEAFIAWIPLIILIAFSMRGIISFVSAYCMTWVARTVVMVMRQELFTHYLALPASYYDQTTSGQLLSKLVYDVEQLAKVSSDALTKLVQASFSVMGLFVVMFVISWKLSLVFLITVPIISFMVKYSNRRIRRVSLSVQKAMGDMTEIAEESIEGYRVVRTFGGQAYERKKFVSATEKNRNQDMKVAATRAFNVAGVQVVAACGISFIFFLAMSPNSVFMLSAGGFVSLISAMLAILKPLKQLTNVNSSIQRGLAGAQSVFALLDEATEKDMGDKTLETVKGQIDYQHIHFTYQSSKKTVLHDINFTISPGQSVAFIGRSGSGKSTIISLLSRFYEVGSGQILLDGIDIRDVSLKSLRAQIALVSQDVTLFNDTIANNIAYGASAKVSEEDIISAAESAHALSFIRALPDSLQTHIGEDGILLSGGQRQRIAIARAILKEAPILILDEATSALDTESERHIQAALDEVMRNRTTLIIAHRLSTIENADKLIVLDDGKIVEVGTHQELLAKNGAYAHFHAMQFNEKGTVDDALEQTTVVC